MMNLSNDAKRVLRDIHQRGVIWLSSFGSDILTYADNEDDVPRADVLIITRELRHVEEVPYSYINPHAKLSGVRRRRDGDFVIVEHVILDANNTVTDSREVAREMIAMDDNVPFDYDVIDVHVPWNYEVRGVQRTETLGLLTGKAIDDDDWYQENVGLRSRLLLTDKALALLGSGE